MMPYWIISLIGSGMVILGMIILLRPLAGPVIIDFVSKRGKGRLYLVGAIRIFLGLLLLFSAQESRAYSFVISLGIIIFTAGLLTFFISQNKIMAIFSYWKEKPLYVFRLFSCLVMAIGFGLIYAAF